MYFLVQFVLLLFVLQCHVFIGVLGECCPTYAVVLCKPDGTPSQFTAQYCLDCSDTYFYCGNGDCNVFGCNCDGGCKTGENCTQPCKPCRDMAQNNPAKLTKEIYNVPSFTIDTIMQGADLDRDGLLNIEEAANWLSQVYDLPKQRLVSRIKAVDKNKDGFISRQEIDG